MTNDEVANWNDLSRIHEVVALGEDDRVVLQQIAEVLERNGASDRFGITLLHSHFDIDDTEVLVERVDSGSKTLTITTEAKESFESSELVPTSWRFVGSQIVPLQYCHRPKDSVYHQI